MDKLMATLKKIALEIAALRQDVDELKRREIPAGLWKAYTPAGYAGWTALPGGTYRYALFGNVVFLVILGPIFEEWMFRKQLIDHTRKYGEKTAILLSGLAFGLFHMNLFQFFYAFLLGVMFGYIYMRTSKLRYSTAMHMIIK